MSQITREYFVRAFRKLATCEVSAEVVGETLVLPSLGISVSVGMIEENTETNVVSAEILAAHDRLPIPVAAILAGFGNDLPAAANTAAEQWFHFIFPVLHSVFADHPTENVTLGNLSASTKRGEKFQWRVHVGPVRVVYAGDPVPSEPEAGIFVKTLMHEITREAAQRVPLWLDSFVARHADETIHVDCRLLNETWPDAEERLRANTGALVPANSGFISYRQFVFFEPADAGQPFQGPKTSWLGRLFKIGG